MMAEPKKATCHTLNIALWDCPGCKFPNQTEIGTDYPQDEEVKCSMCKRKALISEDE
jgi:hypothetical protein